MIRLLAILVVLVTLTWIFVDSPGDGGRGVEVVLRLPADAAGSPDAAAGQPETLHDVDVKRSEATSEGGGRTAGSWPVAPDEAAAPIMPTYPARCGVAVLSLTFPGGEPVGEGWVGLALTVNPLATDVPRPHVVTAAFDTVAGICVIEGVEPGGVILRAVHESFPTVETRVLELEPDGMLEETLVARGARHSGRIDVRYELPPFDGIARLLRRQSPIVADLLEDGVVVGALDGRGVAAPGPGPFTIRVNDPRFLPVSIDGVRPGQSRTIELAGSAAVILEVLDAAGEPCEEFSLDAGAIGRIGGRRLAGRLRHAELPLPDDMRFALPPGMALEMVVDAGARGRAKANLAPLEPGEERALRLTLPTGRRLVNVEVTRGRGREPAPDVEVALVTVPIMEDTPVAHWIRWKMASRRVAPGALIADAAITDAKGRVLLGAPIDAGAGTWTVCTLDGGRLHSTKVVTDPVPVHLAGYGAIALNVTGVPAGVAFPPVGARLTVMGGERESLYMGRQPGSVPFIRAGALFGAADVTEGRHSVVMEFSNRFDLVHAGLVVAAFDVPLVVVDVVEGETSHVRIDAGPFLPGTLRAVVVVNGVPLAEAKVTATAVGETGALATQPPDADGPVRQFLSHTDTNGVAEFQVLPSGVWTLVVSAAERVWSTTGTEASARVTLEAGEVRTVRIEIATHSARVAIRQSPGGEALRDVAVLIVPILADNQRPRSTRVRETDADGMLELTLPVGKYTLARHFSHFRNPSDDRALEFTWPLDAAGEQVLTLPPLR